MNGSGEGKGEGTIEEIIFVLLFAVASVMFLAPLVLWKSAEREPQVYQKIKLKSILTVSAGGLAISTLLSGILVFLPEWGECPLFSMGHLIVRVSLILKWIVVNSSLFSVAFLTLPIWSSKLTKKDSLREEVY